MNRNTLWYKILFIPDEITQTWKILPEIFQNYKKSWYIENSDTKESGCAAFSAENHKWLLNTYQKRYMLQIIYTRICGTRVA